jgi:hypothetical protein
MMWDCGWVQCERFSYVCRCFGDCKGELDAGKIVVCSGRKFLFTISQYYKVESFVNNPCTNYGAQILSNFRI